MIIVSFILLALSSICNSVMDTITHHYDTSIFKDIKNRAWWDPNKSWRNKYLFLNPQYGRVKWKVLGFLINKPVQITDAFHFFKMWMIILFCGSIVCALYACITLVWWHFPLFLLGYGTTWNMVFSLFYDKILKKV